MFRSASEDNYFGHEVEMSTLPERVYSDIPFDNNNPIRTPPPKQPEKVPKAGKSESVTANEDYECISMGSGGIADELYKSKWRHQRSSSRRTLHGYDNIFYQLDGEGKCQVEFKTTGTAMSKKDDSVIETRQQRPEENYHTVASKTPLKQQQNVFLSSSIAYLVQVFIAMVATASLILAILMVTGIIVIPNSSESQQGNMATTTADDVPTHIKEMKQQISQLGKQLNLTRKELANVRKGGKYWKNSLEGQITVVARGTEDLETRVNMAETKLNVSSHAAVKRSVAMEKRLNSTYGDLLRRLANIINSSEKNLMQQRYLTQKEIRKVRGSVNHTKNQLKKELNLTRHELKVLKTEENRTQLFADSLKTEFQKHLEGISNLTTEIASRFTDIEARIEELVTKVNYSKQQRFQQSQNLATLVETVNTTMINKLREAATSVKSTDRALREHRDAIKKELVKLWTVLNSTYMQVTNASANRGPQGPPGLGNFSLCQYNVADSGAITAGHLQSTDVTVTEPQGMKIIGATCSTNIAEEYIFSGSTTGNRTEYTCYCSGVSSSSRPGGSMHCYLHYWECPIER